MTVRLAPTGRSIGEIQSAALREAGLSLGLGVQAGAVDTPTS
jgi:hypothetical protein